MTRWGVWQDEEPEGTPEPAWAPPAAADPAQLPLLPALEGWPQRPAAPQAEQRPLPLPGTLAGAYAAWRGTEEGERVFRFVQSEAVGDARAGARRLSIDAYTQAARRAFRLKINDHHRAFLARELEEAEPCLRGLFEKRKRTAL